MKEGGLRLLVVGFETGDPQVLKNIRKGRHPGPGTPPGQMVQGVGHSDPRHLHGGLPGETKASIEASIRFACELDPDTIQVSLATPYPGTEFYDFCREQGYLQDDALVNGATGFQQCVVDYPGLAAADIFQALHPILPPVLLPAPLHGPGGPGHDAGPGGKAPLAQGRPPVLELYV